LIRAGGPDLAELEVANQDSTDRSRDVGEYAESAEQWSNVITLDDDRIKSHLDRIVRGSVEETLNARWTLRQIGCAMRNATSAARRVAIPVLVITSANCMPRPARCG
jgi:hypothetical protein